MNKLAILTASAISAMITTILLAILFSYFSTNDTFNWYEFGLLLLLNGVLVFPVTFMVCFPVWLVLYRIKLFNIFVVSLVGIGGAITAGYMLSTSSSWTPMNALGLGIVGSFISITAFVAYKYLTNKSSGMPKDSAALI